MTETILFDFKYKLPSGTPITVYARHTPGLPERKPSLDHAGEPADEGEIEIEGCEFHGEEIDLEGLYFVNKELVISINENIEGKAWEALEDVH